MPQITVKTGTTEPSTDSLLKGHIGLRLDQGNIAIYTGDSDASPSEPVKVTNNYSDSDKQKIDYIDVTKSINMDDVEHNISTLDMFNTMNNNMADATCKVYNDGSTPISLGTNDTIVPITEDIASNDTDIIGIDAVSNYVSFKEPGRYAVVCVSSIETGSVETADFIVSLVASDNSLITQNSYVATSVVGTTIGEVTEVKNFIVIDVPTAVDAYLSVKTNPSSSFVFNGFTAEFIVDTADSKLSNKVSTADFTAHTNDVSNPHSVTKEQVGLGNADNTSDADKPISVTTQSALDLKADMSVVSSHTNDISNPHSVTKGQVGLSNVDNTSDSDKPISTATQSALDLKANGSVVSTHTTDTSNPHSVTKGQVGLSNVDNTSDSDKPISTATQSALDLKADGSAVSAHTNDVSNPHEVTKEQVGLGNVDNTSDVDKPVSTATQNALDSKQATLVSQTNIKSINGASLIGSGNINVAPASNYAEKHSAYTAVDNDSIFVDTSAGSVTIALPDSPTTYSKVTLTDLTSSFSTNSLIIGRNGNNIMGLDEDMEVSIDNISLTLIYVNNNWRLV